ncbi:MAG: hypothetical protein H6704_00680 [Myxococcales bacterium]|nr:hypothetical protein [Myxococcales bacterium]
MSQPVALVFDLHAPGTLDGDAALLDAAVDLHLPLIAALRRLARDGLSLAPGVVLPPAALTRLAEPATRDALAAHLAARVEAAPAADADRLRALQRLHADALEGDVVGAWRALADADRLEPITTPIADVYLPLVADRATLRTLVQAAAAEHRRHFHREPAGFRPTDLGWSPRVAQAMAEADFTYGLVDAANLPAGATALRCGASGVLVLGHGAAGARVPRDVLATTVPGRSRAEAAAAALVAAWRGAAPEGGPITVVLAADALAEAGVPVGDLLDALARRLAATDDLRAITPGGWASAGHATPAGHPRVGRVGGRGGEAWCPPEEAWMHRHLALAAERLSALARGPVDDGAAAALDQAARELVAAHALPALLGAATLDVAGTVVDRLRDHLAALHALADGVAEGQPPPPDVVAARAARTPGLGAVDRRLYA